MAARTQVNILCFNTSLWKDGAAFDRNREISASIREVEQKRNSEMFAAYLTERILASNNAGAVFGISLNHLEVLVGSLFNDYCDRIVRYRGADMLGFMYDIAFWDREMFRCLYGRATLPGVFDGDAGKRILLRNSVILHARELTLRKRASLMNVEGYNPGVIPFDFWNGRTAESGREMRLPGANRDYCASRMKECQNKYVAAERGDTAYHPYSQHLSKETKSRYQEWSELLRSFSSRISARRVGRDEHIRSHMFWFLSAYNAISGITGTVGSKVKDLYRFEYNHDALWMSVGRLEMEFLQDMMESPLLGTETGPSRRAHDIRHYICEGQRSAGEILDALHVLIEGHDGKSIRKGREVAKVVRAAHAAGLLTQANVPYSAMKKEFPNIGAESGYYKYLDPHSHLLMKADFQPMIDSLKEFAKGK